MSYLIAKKGFELHTASVDMLSNGLSSQLNKTELPSNIRGSRLIRFRLVHKLPPPILAERSQTPILSEGSRRKRNRCCTPQTLIATWRNRSSTQSPVRSWNGGMMFASYQEISSSLGCHCNTATLLNHSGKTAHLKYNAPIHSFCSSIKKKANKIFICLVYKISRKLFISRRKSD